MATETDSLSRAPSDIAWCGGLFEGEGSLGFWRHRKSRQPKLQLSMTDEDTVRRFSGVLGVSLVRGPYRYNTWKPQWVWSVGGFEKVQAVLVMLWPWLGARRRAKAIEVLTRARSAPSLPQYRTQCPHGHPLRGQNLSKRASGKRVCRECVRRRAGLARQRQRHFEGEK